MFTRFFCWFRDFCWTPAPKAWEPKPDPYAGIQVFGGDGEDQANPYKDWPRGWRADRSKKGVYQRLGRLLRCDGVYLSWEIGFWIIFPDGTQRAGNDPQQHKISPRDVMEFTNEVYPIGTTEYPPNKFDKMWDDLKAK